MTLAISGTNGLLQSYDYQVLVTGFTYTFAAGTQVLLINPAAALATGTITMPSSPSDGMTITITSTQPIATLTVNANTGQSISNGGALGLQAGGALTYVYNLANTTWRPFNASLQLGVGQTWQAVTRVSGTTYTNSTGRPIVNTTMGTATAAGNPNINIVVGGVTVSNQTVYTNSAGYLFMATAIIPANTSYVITVTAATISSSVELR
jgi:hypothetical protein